MMFLSKNWYFSVQKALIYYTVNKSHHNSFILLVFSHVANFRYVANFRFVTLPVSGLQETKETTDMSENIDDIVKVCCNTVYILYHNRYL